MTTLADKHGTRSAYVNRGCRCAECRAANTAYQQQATLRRATREPLEHGKESTYINWKCRCEACSEAHSARLRVWRERRREAEETS